ncbi:MAG: serine/threonine protein kinase [Polyangiaceae bacterium]|nr:serine/threonine protein kinase [Polyangiaceae bacterium]
MRPQVGQLINNKYRLVRMLGDGGMGSVFEATHEVLGSSVALKFLHPELARRQGLVQRFLQEARVSAKIESKHVVRVSDVEQTGEGLPFMVMELLSGKSLQALYEELYRAHKRLSFEDGLRYAMQILDGLEAAHEEGVVHRDLKPDNVMIVTGKRGESVVKLLDFGIAKLKINGELYKGLTRPGVIMGTPEYMAPEQVFSADQVDARADIFSCGVMFFEMFAGRRPVGGDEAHQIAAQYLGGTVAKLSDLAPHVPQGLVDAVHRAMSADPKARFGSVSEMRSAMEPFTHGVVKPQLSTPPPSPIAAASSPVSASSVDGGATEKVSEPYRGSNPPGVSGEKAAEYAAISARLKAALGDKPNEFDATVEGAPYQPGATEGYEPQPMTQRPGGTDVGAGMQPMVPATATYGGGSVSNSPTPYQVSQPPAVARRKKKGLGMGSILLLAGVAAALVTGGVFAVDQYSRSSDDEPRGKSGKTVPLPSKPQTSHQTDPTPVDPQPQVNPQPTPTPTTPPTPTTTTPTSTGKPGPGPKPSASTTTTKPPPWVIPSAIPGIPTSLPGLPPEWNIPGVPGGGGQQQPPPPKKDPGQPKLEPITPTGSLETPSTTQPATTPATTEPTRPTTTRPTIDASKLPHRLPRTEPATPTRPTTTHRPSRPRTEARPIKSRSVTR